MRLTDGKKTVEITIRTWNGTQWGEDWSRDYFQGIKNYDRLRDVFVVKDVDYCIDMANDTTAEGARSKYDSETDTWAEDENVDVDVTELPTEGEEEE